MISRRIIAAVALLCAFAMPAHAQKTKAQLNTEIGVLFPNNDVGAITPSVLRTVTSDVVNSIMPTAPVVSGNLACFSGTTGLLQDCGSPPKLPCTLTANSIQYNAAGSFGCVSGATSNGTTLTMTTPVIDTSVLWKFSGTSVGTESVANPAATSPSGSYVTTWQGTTAGATTSHHILPAVGAVATGTISEYVMGTTPTQAFGGDYGRWSLSNSGSSLSYVAGMFGEYGGATATGALGPFVFQIGVENPASTFTTYEYMRLQTKDGGAEDSQVGAVLFGANQPNPGTQQNRISIIKPNIGTAGQRDSDAVLWEGKANNGTERAVWWRQYADVTSNAGGSSFTWQSNLNGAGWVTRATLSDGGTLGITGLAGTTTNDNAAAGNVGEYVFCNASPTVAGAIPTSTVTITIASPGVITWTGHLLTGNSPVVFTNSGGALPTGITSGTVYYAVGSSITTNTFQIATTIPNAIAGTSVTTTGSQSGTQTGTLDVPLTNNIPANVCAVSLTAGDWDVRGKIAMGGAASTTVSYLAGSLSNTSATLDQSANRDVTAFIGGAAIFPTLPTFAYPLGPNRFSLSGTTTLFLVAQSGFAVSTNNGGGFIEARRVR